jgi:hypothetical protein
VTSLILNVLGGVVGAALMSRIISRAQRAGVSIAIIGIVGGGAAGQLTNHFWPLIANQPTAWSSGLAFGAGAIGGVVVATIIATSNSASSHEHEPNSF